MKKVLVIVICGFVVACTIAPKPVVSHQASFDNNAQNSGIVTVDNEGFIVTQHFIQRHGITNYEPAGKNFRISAQTMSEAIGKDIQKRQ